MEYLLPDNWHLVHGKEDSIRNYGTLPVVRDHKTYINGEEVSSDLVVRNGSTLFNYIEGRFVKENAFFSGKAVSTTLPKCLQSGKTLKAFITLSNHLKGK